MNSVDKLREWAQKYGPMGSHDPLMLADEIECEIAERYQLLPVDADGVEIGSVTAVGFNAEPRVWVLPDGKNVSVSFCAKGVKHYHPPTVEDVLEEFGRKFAENYHYPHADDLIEKTADKLREVLRDE